MVILAYAVYMPLWQQTQRAASSYYLPVRAVQQSTPIERAVGLIPPGSTILLVGSQGAADYPLFGPDEGYPNRVISWGKDPFDPERMQSILDGDGVTHILIENKWEVWHQWTAPVSTLGMVEWLRDQLQVAEVGTPFADMKLYRTVHAANLDLQGRSASAPVVAGCGALGFGQIAAFYSPDMEQCLELSSVVSTGSQFIVGEPLPVRLDWDLNGQPVPEVRIRIRLEYHPWLPWRAPSSMAEVDRLLSDCCTWAMEGMADEQQSSTAAFDGTLPPNLGHDIALPLVVRGYGGTARRPCACQVTLPVPGDGPTGRTTVLVEVVGTDGVRWTTAAGDGTVRSLDVMVHE
jgi:hypothetical protein